MHFARETSHYSFVIPFSVLSLYNFHVYFIYQQWKIYYRCLCRCLSSTNYTQTCHVKCVIAVQQFGEWSTFSSRGPTCRLLVNILLLYPTQRDAEGIMFLTRPSVSLSVSPVFLVSATPLKPLNRISWNVVVVMFKTLNISDKKWHSILKKNLHLVKKKNTTWINKIFLGNLFIKCLKP